MAFDDLPKIDLVLVSHDHFDHLDKSTLRQIAVRDSPSVLAGLNMKRHLKPLGFGAVIEQDWWQEWQGTTGNLKITFVPAVHGSGRGLFDRNRTLWGGFVLEGPSGRVYFAGDTGYGKFLDAIADRFKSFRLTILPIGAYESRWFMRNQHMNPDDAVRTHQLLHSGQSMGIHYATFAEHPEQSIDAHERDLAVALINHKVPMTAFWVLGFGERRSVP